MSASLESLIISKVIDEQSLESTTKFGLRAEHFTTTYRPVYEWILAYNQEHGSVPTDRAFSKAHGSILLDDASSESWSGLVDEMMVQYKFRTIADVLTRSSGELDNDDVEKAISTLQSGLTEATKQTSKLRDFDIIQDWEERLAKYNEMRDNPNALRGIPTGFHGLDQITQGFRPQQFVVLVGEPKRGKSLFELIMANAAHYSGRTPLFVSFEMSVQEQLSRWDALRAKVDYNSILTGNLSNQEMDRIERQMILAKNMQPFYMSEDSTSLTTVSALDAKVQEYRPDALYVDGGYLMDDDHGEPKGSPQALTNITRSMKRLAQKWDIPVILTTQVLSWKLGNKKTRAITADSIGYTSSFVQDADLVLGVERNPDADDQSIIRVVEARTAPRCEVHVSWDWATMDFTELHNDEEAIEYESEGFVP